MGLLSYFLSNNNLDNVYILKENYNDISDRFNWQFTVNLLIIFTFLVSNVTSFVNKIISCAVPINFSENQEEYANQVCYISDKYYVGDSERIVVSQNFTLEPLTLSHDQAKSPLLVSYYVWVPYILLGQALLFLFIKRLWIFMLEHLTRLDMGEILKSVQMSKNNKEIIYFDDYSNRFEINPKAFRNVHLRYLMTELSKLIYQGFGLKKKITFLSIIFEKKICITYFFVKFLNLVNILVQMFLMKIFLRIDIYNLTLRPLVRFFYDLNPNFWLFKNYELKIESYENYFFETKSIYLANSHYFPLKSMCIFKIREIMRTNSYAVMCSLPINLFIQYIFVFLSIWYLVLLVLNIYFIFKWVMRFKNKTELNYVKKRVIMSLINNGSSCSKIRKTCYHLYHLRRKFKKHKFDTCKCECDVLLEKFVYEYLNSDFIFLLRIISLNETNKSDALVQNVLIYFWKLFLYSEPFQ